MKIASHKSTKLYVQERSILQADGTKEKARPKAVFRSPTRGKSSGKGDETATNRNLKIREEGWVETGVYGFELSGYSIFAGKGTSDFKYDT